MAVKRFPPICCNIAVSYTHLLMVGDITDIYVNSFQRMLRDGNFRPEELSAIAFGYTKLLEESNEVLTELKNVCLLYTSMEGSSEIGIRIKGLIEIRLKKPEKEFVVPDNIEEFDIRNYV